MLRTDMRVTCKHCGGPHPAFECRKKSTAARKDVPLSSEDSPFARGRRGADGAKAAVDIGSNPRPTAGTQALPVDTNPRQGGGNTAVIDPSGGGLPVFHLPSPKTGTKFDKKTWMRSYMKTYMARYREDVKRGKRTPKKKVKAS